MSWLVVAAHPRARAVRRIASRLGLDPPRDLAAAAGSDVAAAGIAVIGGDADLAAVALARLDAGRRVPLALLPAAGSDLLRMFAKPQSDLADGAPYPSDLGMCSHGDSITPFVSHLTGRSRIGRTAAFTITAHRTWEVRGWRCVVANAQHLRGRAVAPRAALMDGELDIQIHGGARRRIRGLTRHGLHLAEPGVWRRSLGSAEIALPSPWRLAADGRDIGAGSCSVRTEVAAFDLWI